MGHVRTEGTLHLRRSYPLVIQAGLIAALLLTICAFQLDWRVSPPPTYTPPDQPTISIEEIIQTNPYDSPPPPPRPAVPVVVPNDRLLDDIDLDPGSILDFQTASDILGPPPSPPVDPDEDEQPEYFEVVQEMPELIGGLASIRLTYPAMARRAGVEGRVIVQFIVDEEGRGIDPVVLRGIGAGCDEEALRAIKQARFTPGRQRGKAVRVKMSLPIVFRLK